MLDPDFSIRDDFPATDYRQWLELVESSLRGKSFEEELVTRSMDGLTIRPLYVQDDFEPHARPGSFVGNQPFSLEWVLRQEYFEAEPSELNPAIVRDIEGGVDSVLIALDGASRSGIDPDSEQARALVGDAGLMAYCADDLAIVLKNVDVKSISVGLLSGASFLPAAAMLVAACQRKGVRPDEARLSLGSDPLGTLAREGRLPISFDNAFGQLTALAEWTVENSPFSSSVSVDTLPYHEAGCNAVQELAIAIATAAEYVRALTGGGMTLEEASGQLEFRFGVGTHHFAEMSKLRATRLLWSRVVDVFGGKPEQVPMRVHARLGNRALTALEPEGNILRNTVAVFAAGLGGADSIASVPFDAWSGNCGDFSRRIARNTATILQSEAQLHRVIDPARGSWFLETITHDLAEQAWQEFQRIEAQGGIVGGLLSGRLAKEIDAVHEERAKAYASGKQAIVGVNAYRDPAAEPVQLQSRNCESLQAEAVRRMLKHRKDKVREETPVAASGSMNAAIEAAADGATMGELATAWNFHQDEVTAHRLQQRRCAEPFETESSVRLTSP